MAPVAARSSQAIPLPLRPRTVHQAPFAVGSDLPAEELLFGVLRAGRAAKTVLDGDQSLPEAGAVLDIPCVVPDPPTGRWVPIDLHVEPGTPLAEGPHTIPWSVTGTGWAASGRLAVLVSDDPWLGAPSSVVDVQRRGPALVPVTVRLPVQTRATIRRRLRVLARDRAAAIHEGGALWTNRQVRLTLRKASRSARAACKLGAAFDQDDLRSVVREEIIRGAEQFAGPARPAVAWSTWLTRNVLRQPVRAAYARRDGGISIAESELRAKLDGMGLMDRPLPDVLAVLDREPRRRRISPQRVEAALAPLPHVKSLDAAVGYRADIVDDEQQALPGVEAMTVGVAAITRLARMTSVPVLDVWRYLDRRAGGDLVDSLPARLRARVVRAGPLTQQESTRIQRALVGPFVAPTDETLSQALERLHQWLHDRLG